MNRICEIKIKRGIILVIGMFLKQFSRFVCSNNNIWIFGSSKGLSYNENSKYLHEYVRRTRNDIKCVWITRNKEVIKNLRKENYNVYSNYSLIGLFYILCAKYYFFSTTRSDVYYFYTGRKKKIINLWHGMPIKKIVFDYKNMVDLEDYGSFKTKMWNRFVTGSKYEDMYFSISTSAFFSKFLKTAFNNPRVFNSGLPRNDLFFLYNLEELKKKLNIKEKYIVSYLPTHRGYGKGPLNPLIFGNNKIAEKYFSKYSIKILVKFHPNMEGLDRESSNSNVINISQNGFDAQEILAISDILITDYSSCYIDYLLLNRPIIFYHYDSYEENDNELYFRIDDYKVGPIVKNEDELFYEIKKILGGQDEFQKSREYVTKIFHKNVDGDSSRRIIDILLNEYKNE